jgi:hypothetical protein
MKIGAANQHSPLLRKTDVLRIMIFWETVRTQRPVLFGPLIFRVGFLAKSNPLGQSGTIYMGYKEKNKPKTDCKKSLKIPDLPRY